MPANQSDDQGGGGWVGGGKSGGGSNSGNPPSPHDDRAPMQGTREARWEEGEEERGGNCDCDWDIVSRQPGQPAPFSGLLQYARKQF